MLLRSVQRLTNTRECGWHSLPWQMQSNKRPQKSPAGYGCGGFEVALLFEEHEERNIVIVVRHIGSARLAFRRGHGIDGSLSAVECAGPVPEEFAGASVHRTDRPIAVALNSGQFGRHRPVDFAVVLLEMLGIFGFLVENDEFDHWYLPLFWRSDKLSDNRIDKLRDVVNKAARDCAPVEHQGLVQHAGADFEIP